MPVSNPARPFRQRAPVICAAVLAGVMTLITGAVTSAAPRIRTARARPTPMQVASAVIPARAEPVDFNRDVRPIISENCFKCHGFDPATRLGGFRLDMPDNTTVAGKSGAIPIVPAW